MDLFSLQIYGSCPVAKFDYWTVTIEIASCFVDVFGDEIEGPQRESLYGVFWFSQEDPSVAK